MRGSRLFRAATESYLEAYTLVRSTDLLDFSTIVKTKLATGTTYTFTDTAPLPSGTSSKAFYRLQD